MRDWTQFSIYVSYIEEKFVNSDVIKDIDKCLMLRRDPLIDNDRGFCYKIFKCISG